jgi:hypothetical protein
MNHMAFTSRSPVALYYAEVPKRIYPMAPPPYATITGLWY